MPEEHSLADYEAVTPPRARTPRPAGRRLGVPPPAATEEGRLIRPAAVAAATRPLKRGHALTFAGLLLFTFILYFRPYELISALSGFASMAFWTAISTLAIYFPTQLALEGNLSARPRE